MRHKGFLRTPDNVYILSPKITTVGREGCDLVIQNPMVDDQHAVIEFVEAEDCFVLKDLDSNQGTFVNECRIQNASVRLAPGDVIRFGYPCPPYEFVVESTGPQVVYPPVAQSRSTWQQQSLRLIGDAGATPASVPLPNIGPPPNYPQRTVVAPQQPLQPVLNAWATTPYPPTNGRASRPSSATRRQAAAAPRGGWVTGPPRGSTHSPGRESPVPELILQEKEAKLMQLQAEMNRLHGVDDNAVETLRQQVAALQIQMGSLAADSNVRSKLAQLEQEVAAKKAEVAQLRDRLQQMSHGSASGHVPTSSAAEAMELMSVRSELDRVRKDKQISSGLVSQLQKDLTSRDTSISRLTRELEALRMAVEEKEAEMSRLQVTVSESADDGRREKELVALRQKFKVAENKVQEQSGFIQSLKSNVEQANCELRRNEQKLTETQQLLDSTKAEYVDLQRSERIARVDLQEASKRFERLRNRTMQIAFAVGSERSAGSEVKDEEVIEMLKQILDERNSFQEKLANVEEELSSKLSVDTGMEEGTTKWAAHLSAMNERLKGAGCRTGALSDEVELMLSEPVPDMLQAAKEATANCIRQQLDWHRETEAALESCGYSFSALSSERPQQHILDLNTKLETACTDLEQARARLQEVMTNHESELAKLTESHDREKEELKNDAIAAAQTVTEEEKQKAVEEAIAEKIAQYEELRAEDLKKIEELQNSGADKEALEARIQDLEAKLAEMNAESTKFKDLTSNLQQECESLAQQLTTSRTSPTAEERAEMEQVRVELQEARTEIERLKEVERTSEENARALSELRGEMGELRRQSDEEGQETRHHHRHHHHHQTRHEMVENTTLITDLEASLEELKSQLEASNLDRVQLEERLKEQETAAAEAEAIVDLRTQSQLESEVERLTSEVERLLRDNATSSCEVQRLTEELKQMQESKAGEASRTASRASRRSSVDAGILRTQLEEALARIRDLSSEMEGLRSQEQVDEVMADLQARLAASEMAVTRLTGELELARSMAAQMQVEEEEAKVKAEVETVGSQGEVSAYKEQVRQHAVTICSLEERLETVVKQNQELQGRVADVTKENKNLRKRRSNRQENNAAGEQLQNSQAVDPVPPLAAVVVPKPHVEIAAMERSLLGLRQENANLKKGVAERDRTIAGLRQDLSGAVARLSDMQGELTDEQKQEVWAAKTERQAIQERMDESLSKMAQLSKMVDNLNETIVQRDKQILSNTETIEMLETALKERERQVEELEDSVRKEKERNSIQMQSMEDEGRINTELTAMGAQCRGERHEQIICHQKEALAELRSRVKRLETVRAPLPSHDQAVQQVVMLKKELAEMRAAQALKDSKLTSSASFPAIMDRRPTESSNNAEQRAGSPDHFVPQAVLEQQRVEMNSSIEQERTAHRQTMKALEESERSFNDMLRALAAAIHLESIAGITSIAHLNEDERSMVRSERETAINTICQRIKVLNERLQRKEELLQNYEQDLARLSQAEMLASKKHDQVEKLVKDVRARTEETAMLRQSLNNTREVLNREKLLNEAIKQKKTFHMEVKKMPKPPLPQTPQQPRPHCPRDDIFNKEQKRKQRMLEREKRKDYEISSLKTRLTARERELCRATTRLATIETTLGLTGEPELE